MLINFIGHNAFRQCEVVPRKRISGRTLPGKSHLKQKKKKIVTRRAPLGHFRWAPFFLYCQQIKSFRPTARTPAFISFILCDHFLAKLYTFVENNKLKKRSLVLLIPISGTQKPVSVIKEGKAIQVTLNLIITNIIRVKIYEFMRRFS